MYPIAIQSVGDSLGGATDWLSALPDWQAFLLLVGGSIVAAAVLQVGGDLLVRRLTARIPGDVDDTVFGYVHLAVWVTVLLWGPYLGMARLGALDGLTGPFGALALTGVILIWSYVLIRIGPPIFQAITDSTALEAQVVPIFQNVWTVVIAGGALLGALAIWEIDVTPLLASAGILGIVVGLAAQDTIANFFGSLSLYADGTYAVGDYVVLASGERGQVEDVTVRSTVIRTRDDILVTIPNSELNTVAIVNESTPRQHRRIRIPVSVAYGTDVDAVETVMLDVAAESDLIRARPKPRVRLREFGDSGLQIDLLCWIEDPRFRGRARDALLREVYREFTASDVEIPYPQRDLRVRRNDDEHVVDEFLDAATAGAEAESRGGSKAN